MVKSPTMTKKRKRLKSIVRMRRLLLRMEFTSPRMGLPSAQSLEAAAAIMVGARAIKVGRPVEATMTIAMMRNSGPWRHRLRTRAGF